MQVQKTLDGSEMEIEEWVRPHSSFFDIDGNYIELPCMIQNRRMWVERPENEKTLNDFFEV